MSTVWNTGAAAMRFRLKNKKKQRGLTKKEERLGWITRGHEPQAASAKLQAPAGLNSDTIKK